MQIFPLVLKRWEFPLGYPIHHPNILKFVLAWFLLFKNIPGATCVHQSIGEAVTQLLEGTGLLLPQHRKFHNPGMNSPIFLLLQCSPNQQL